MASFDTALNLVLMHEGGFANNVLDAGGPTNYGVSSNVYAAYLGRTVSSEDVKAMPLAAARDIYTKSYWTPMQCIYIADQDVANWIMDMSVLRGVQAASRTVQAVLGVVVDGVIGKKTIAALNACKPAQFLVDFYQLCMKAFIGIVQNKPSQIVFLQQWASRASEMLDVAVR